ncbi:MAG: hypothetical protein PVI87_08215 [Gammaproteobacteria bacterium]|jgi:hypothetical protein
MMNRIEQFADSLKAESRQLADRAVAGLRTAGLETAGLISRTRKPVDAFTDAALKLNNLSHKRIEELLKQQVKVLDELIDGSAGRIEKAAKAKDISDLKDVIVVDFGALGAPKKAPARKKPAARKATAKKRTTRKAPAKRRTTTRKATARKATARKTSAKKAA